MVTAVGAIVQATHQRAELVRFYREALGLGDPDAVGGHQYFMVGDIHLGIDSGDPRLRGPLPRTGVTFVVDDPAPVAEGFGAMFGMSAADVMAYPHALIGPTGAICDELERRRAEYGISYVTVNDQSFEAFAPVVARLGGR